MAGGKFSWFRSVADEDQPDPRTPEGVLRDGKHALDNLLTCGNDDPAALGGVTARRPLPLDD